MFNPAQRVKLRISYVFKMSRTADVDKHGWWLHSREEGAPLT